MRKIKKNKTKKMFKKKKNSYGGAAIDAGSYGCVFDPVLKCDKPIPITNPNIKYISKLMYKEDAVKELNEIKKVEKIIKEKMPPSSIDFFLVSDTYQCNMAELQDKDLESFNKECDLFTKRGINNTNINQFKHKLALFNMPYGGLNVDKHIDKLLLLQKTMLYPAFIGLNNALINLLVKGIVPLNATGFIHGDVKSGNIVVSTTTFVKARLIDWGLSFETDGKTIPKMIQNKAIQFNVPFSSIFFNSFIKEWLLSSYKKIKSSIDFKGRHTSQSEILKMVAVNLLNETIHKEGEGHFTYLTKYILPDIYRIYVNRTKTNVL